MQSNSRRIAEVGATGGNTDPSQRGVIIPTPDEKLTAGRRAIRGKEPATRPECNEKSPSDGEAEPHLK